MWLLNTRNSMLIVVEVTLNHMCWDYLVIGTADFQPTEIFVRHGIDNVSHPIGKHQFCLRLQIVCWEYRTAIKSGRDKYRGVQKVLSLTRLGGVVNSVVIANFFSMFYQRYSTSCMYILPSNSTTDWPFGVPNNVLLYEIWALLWFILEIYFNY